MRILVVISELRYGGVQRVVSRLTQEWARSHQVTIAVFDGHAKAFPAGGKIHDFKTPLATAMPMQVYYSVVRALRLARLIHQKKPTHIISFLEYANLITIMTSLLTGNLGRTTASLRVSPHYMSPLRHKLMPFLYRLPKRVTAVSAGIKKQLVAIGIPEDKIVFIPNATPAVLNSPPPPPQ